MKECGKKICDTVKHSKGIPTVTVTTDTSKLEKQMVKVYIPGQTEKFTTASGCKVSSKDTVSGEDFTMTLTLESGLNQKLMVMVSIHGKMGIATKVNGTCVSNTEQEQIFSLTETLIREST